MQALSPSANELETSAECLVSRINTCNAYPSALVLFRAEEQVRSLVRLVSLGLACVVVLVRALRWLIRLRRGLSSLIQPYRMT